ncbi:MAG: RNA-protein complex protein Nop10 [Candidatus Bathyarchaeia archaeon]
MRKCTLCNRYTLNQERCPSCGGPLKIPHPAKFSMDDRYQHYRMKMRRLAEVETGPRKAGEDDKKGASRMNG